MPDRSCKRAVDPLQDRALAGFLHVLFDSASTRSLIELRVARADGRMAQRFFAAHRPALAAQVIRATSTSRDVYVGVLARSRAGGSQRDLAPAHRVLWLDFDRPDASATLAAFPIPPTMAVRSGTPGHLHAYWLLRERLSPSDIEQLNRRLATVLDADLHSTDAPRVMRPPGSWNLKRCQPSPTALTSYHPDRICSARELLAALPSAPSCVPARPVRPVARATPGDPLLGLDPAYYVELLTRQAVPRNRKVLCPLHSERVPSLHAYDDPARGWFCFGCRRGGSVYDLASLLWHRSARGDSFLTLRADLQRLLL